MKALPRFAVAVIFMMVALPGAYAQLKPVAYADGDQKLNGLFATPKTDNKRKTGVLILPAWMGIDAHSKNTADKLTALGYYVFVADIYGEGNYPKDPGGAMERATHFRKNIQEYHQRIKLALDQLVKGGADPQNIMVIGFCFGGTGALEAARINLPVKGVVSFHSGLGKDTSRTNQPIVAKVLVLHGADDPFVPEKEVKSFQEEMRSSKADWQMNFYGSSVHSFTDPAAGNDNSKGAAYNEKAARRSWTAMIQFFDELLK